jgi:hypothetical protein
MNLAMFGSSDSVNCSDSIGKIRHRSLDAIVVDDQLVNGAHFCDGSRIVIHSHHVLSHAHHVVVLRHHARHRGRRRRVRWLVRTMLRLLCG